MLVDGWIDSPAALLCLRVSRVHTLSQTHLLLLLSARKLTLLLLLLPPPLRRPSEDEDEDKDPGHLGDTRGRWRFLG